MPSIYYLLLKYLVLPLSLLGLYTLALFYMVRRDLFFDLLGLKNWVLFVDLDPPFLKLKWNLTKKNLNSVVQEGKAKHGTKFVFRGRPAYLSHSNIAYGFDVEMDVENRELKLGKNVTPTKEFLKTIVESDIASKIWGVSKKQTALYLIGLIAIVGLMGYLLYLQIHHEQVLKSIAHQVSSLSSEVKSLKVALANQTKHTGEVIPLK